MTLLDRPHPSDQELITLELEVTDKGVWLLESNQRFRPYLHRYDDGSGKITMEIAAEDMKFYVDLIWQWGAEVKIVKPAEAKAYMRQKIESMRSLYF